MKEKRKEPSIQLPDSLFLVFRHRRTQHAQNPSLTSGEQKGVVRAEGCGVSRRAW